MFEHKTLGKHAFRTATVCVCVWCCRVWLGPMQGARSSPGRRSCGAGDVFESGLERGAIQIEVSPFKKFTQVGPSTTPHTWRRGTVAQKGSFELVRATCTIGRGDTRRGFFAALLLVSAALAVGSAVNSDARLRLR